MLPHLHNHSSRRAGRLGATLIAGLSMLLLLASPASAAAGANIIVDDLTNDVAIADNHCTFREAILAANTNTTVASPQAGDCPAGTNGLDRITFSGTGTITQVSTFPDITAPVNIDGGGGATVVMTGGNSISTGLMFVGGSKGSILEGMAIGNYADYGVILIGGSITLKDNWIGTINGTSAADNGIGVWVESSGNKIGVSDAANGTHGNIISGNEAGIYVSSGSGNVIQANWIGVSASGHGSIPNTNTGIIIASDAVKTTIGGTMTGQGNYIGINATGLRLQADATSTKIIHNYFGFDVDLSPVLGNQGDAINDEGSENTVIGGAFPTNTNFFADNNGAAIRITQIGAKLTISGNIIGLDGTGAAALNSDGINIEAPPASLTITNNLISGNGNGINNQSVTLPTKYVINNNCIDNNLTWGVISVASGFKAGKNWWGDASGPTNATTNPLGIGDPASDQVLFAPPLTSPAKACNIFQPASFKPADDAFFPKSTKLTKFTWSKVATTDNYGWLLSDQPNMSSALAQDSLSTTAYSETPLDYGRYYWTVAIMRSDNVNWKSPVFSFDVTNMKTPKPGATVTAGDVKFSWGAVSPAPSGGYTLTTYTDTTCTTGADVHTGLAMSTTLTLAGGDISWRVTSDATDMPCWELHVVTP